MNERPILEIENVTKAFHRTVAIDGVSVDVMPGEFIALVGPSGCGKTTLLKMIGGFETPNSGRILINGQDMSGVPPADRPTNMVFQRLALFPHKTVADNIGFPLKLRKIPAEGVRTQVEDMCRLMHLKEEYLRRYPSQLSGGEQQRVALARSMISQPAILLLDEPLSALDFKLKKNLQAELKRLHRELGVTFVHVTHDLEEAMILADRICVMENGKIIQIGRPSDIYYRPGNDFVAQFIGETNLLAISVDKQDGAYRYTSIAIEDDERRIEPACAAEGLKSGPAHMMVRPELVRILEPGETADCRAEVCIAEVFIKGSVVQYRATLLKDGEPLVFEIPGTMELPVIAGQNVTVGWHRGNVFVFPVPTGS